MKLAKNQSRPSSCSHLRLVILCKIISQIVDRQLKLFGELGVRLCPLAHLQELVGFQSRVRVLREEPSQVLARDGVDYGLVLLTADIAVLVQDRGIGFTLVYAEQTIVKASDIDDTARQT